MRALSALYGRVAGARRAWYGRRPQAVRRLPHPVVSVGNLVVGGSGKTPLVAYLAQLLQGRGEKPAVLSRGYARRESADGVVVVSDGQAMLEPVARAGDEPFMLAEALPGVPVLVCEDRYLAGRLAASRFGATVSILDDGFQHLQLARDADLLVVSPADLNERVLPGGRLREPLASAAAAHALIVPGSREDVSRVSVRLGVAPAFALHLHVGDPRPAAFGPRGAVAFRSAESDGGSGEVPVFAVCGIARPERFLASLEQQGHRVVDYRAFADHHWFTASDVAAVEAAARAVGAVCLITTEKDAVRLAGMAVRTELPWFVLPVRVTIEPADEFADWLAARLQQARAGQGPPSH